MSDVFDIDGADKDALEAYAMKAFGRNIDKRKKIGDLRNEVKAMQSGDLQRAEAKTMAAEAAEEAKKSASPLFVKHKGNGFIFPWHPLYEGNADLEVIEWE